MAFVILGALHQEKCSSGHHFFVLDTGLGPGASPREIRKRTSKAGLIDSHPKVSSQRQPALQRAGPPTLPLGHLCPTEPRRAPAPPPAPQIPAFPSKGPHRGRPRKLIQPVPKWEERHFLPQLRGYTALNLGRRAAVTKPHVLGRGGAHGMEWLGPGSRVPLLEKQGLDSS